MRISSYQFFGILFFIYSISKITGKPIFNTTYIEVQVGSTLELRCNLGPNEDMPVLWRFIDQILAVNNFLLTKDKRFAVLLHPDEGSMLTLESVQEKDGGIYFCNNCETKQQFEVSVKDEIRSVENSTAKNLSLHQYELLGKEEESFSEEPDDFTENIVDYEMQSNLTTEIGFNNTNDEITEPTNITNRPRYQPFRGWLSIPFDDAFKDYNSSSRPAITDDFREGDRNTSLEYNHRRNTTIHFKEEFDIDLEYDEFEQINVPDFNGGRRARFIHDFSTNKTGIIDLDGRRCFVMPLNRSGFLPPDSLFDLVLKLRAGYYNVDTEVVRETMRVVKPPITDYSSLGIHITRECSKLPTFKLERMTKPVFKRSVENMGDPLVFAEFAGKKISQYEVVIEE